MQTGIVAADVRDAHTCIRQVVTKPAHVDALHGAAAQHQEAVIREARQREVTDDAALRTQHRHQR